MADIKSQILHGIKHVYTEEGEQSEAVEAGIRFCELYTKDGMCDETDAVNMAIRSVLEAKVDDTSLEEPTEEECKSCFRSRASMIDNGETIATRSAKARRTLKPKIFA